MMRATRRDFLTMLAAALGSGVVIAGCGGSGNSGSGGSSLPPGSSAGSAAGSSPNGYQFTEVLNSSTFSLPTQNGSSAFSGATRSASAASDIFQAFTGALQLTGGGELIYFNVIDSNGILGLYQAALDFNNPLPALNAVYRMLGQQDTLSDGSVVSSFGVGQGNTKGSYVTVIARAGQPDSLFLGTLDGGFAPFASLGENTPGGTSGAMSGTRATGASTGGGILNGDFSNPAIDDDGNVAYVASYTPVGAGSFAQGVMYTTTPGSAGASGIMVSTQELVPMTTRTVDLLGTLDLAPDGQFVLQAGIKALTTGAQGTASSLPQNMVVQGSVGQPNTRRVVAAPRGAINPLLVTSRDTPEGTSLYAPRITDGGIPVTVLHLDALHLAMYYGSILLFQTGGTSPDGNTIVSMTGASCGSNNRIYFVLICEQAFELVMYDGVTARTILTNNDRVGSRFLKVLYFGLMPNQVDSNDRLASIAEWTDGTSGILIGTPV